jgi:hypothetical protein
MSKTTKITSELNGKIANITISEKDGALPEVSIKKTRVKTVEALYTVVHYHDIPEDVYLLNQSENNGDRKVYGSWWVKYGTLYYIDKELNIQEIEHDEDSLAAQMKIPDTTFTNETDDECDDESDDDENDDESDDE